MSSPSLVSSRVHVVLGPSPFCKVCSQLIFRSVSHLGKLYKESNGEGEKTHHWSAFILIVLFDQSLGLVVTEGCRLTVSKKNVFMARQDKREHMNIPHSA